jgi:predicted nucleic acid-binding protein
LRVVLDVNILVWANDRTAGLARDLLRELLRQGRTILISGEMLVELARVLLPAPPDTVQPQRGRSLDYIRFLKQACEFVAPDTSLAVPIRDAADIAVV